MKGKKQSYAKRLAALFASGSILFFGTIIFLNAMSLDAATIHYALSVVIPFAFAMGFLGFLIGKILDNQKIKPKNKFSKGIYSYE